MNKVAIITGVGRENGIGYAMSEKLAQEGVDIFFTYFQDYDRDVHSELEAFDADGFEKMLTEKYEVRAGSLNLDLSLDESPQKVLNECVSALGAPDILINNACFDPGTSFEEVTPELLQKHYEVNLKAPTFLIKEFVNHWSKSKGGRIINLTSGQSLGVMEGSLAYTTTKAGMEMLVKQLYTILGRKGITINAINPGPTDTGWMDDELKSAITNDVSMGRIGTPEDVANLVSLLIDEKADWITGQVIASEGGLKR